MTSACLREQTMHNGQTIDLESFPSQMSQAPDPAQYEERGNVVVWLHIHPRA